MQLRHAVRITSRVRHASLTTIESFRAAKAALPGRRWGFVPTMGYLHAGHLSLVKRAKAENDRVAVSIFVNPTQFGPHEDLAAYPRDLDRDLSLLEPLGVDLVFNPTPEVMYPPNYQTYVTVEEVTKYLEGAARPGHFRGVATVVAKLFNIVGAERAYFGQKDAQQTIVIKRMVRRPEPADSDHHLPHAARSRRAGDVEPQHLSRRGTSRRRAGALSGVDVPRKTPSIRANAMAINCAPIMRGVIEAEPLAQLDYVSAADATSLLEATVIDETHGLLLSMAVRVGKPRLIDNFLYDSGQWLTGKISQE